MIENHNNNNNNVQSWNNLSLLGIILQMYQKETCIRLRPKSPEGVDDYCFAFVGSLQVIRQILTLLNQLKEFLSN